MEHNSILHLCSEHHECHCLALFMCSPLSSAKLQVTGKHVILLFSRSVPSPSKCICVYLLYSFVLVVVGILFCAEGKKKK